MVGSLLAPDADMPVRRSLVYLVESFQSHLPWSDGNASAHFYDSVLEISTDVTINNTINYKLVLAFVVSWGSIAASIMKGVQSVSKVVRLTVPVPVLLLVVLFFNGIVQEGATDGIDQYLTWDGTGAPA